MWRGVVRGCRMSVHGGLQVVIVGLTFDGEGKMRFVKLDLEYATDGVHMLCAAGTSEGRVFVGGRDGCLHELLYGVDASPVTRVRATRQRIAAAGMLYPCAQILGLGSKARRVNLSEGWVSSIARGVVGEYVLGLVATPAAAVTQIVVHTRMREHLCVHVSYCASAAG